MQVRHVGPQRTRRDAVEDEQAADLEHWAAFRGSWEALMALVQQVGEVRDVRWHLDVDPIEFD